MRKILFFIISIPFLVALGHDLYMFYNKPDTRFRFSDVGFLWSKFHKESHDQWKIKLHETGETIDTLVEEYLPQKFSQKETTETQNDDDIILDPELSQDYTQVDKADYAIVEIPTQTEQKITQKVSKTQNIIGSFLEFTAVFVFGGFAFFVLILNWLFSRGGSGSGTSKGPKGPMKKGAKGGYQYSRK